MSTLILIRGLPGAGKTAVSLKLINAYGDKFVLLDPDYIDPKDTQLPNPFYLRCIGILNFIPQINKLVVQRRKFLLLLEQTTAYLKQDKIVLWAQPFSRIKWIRKIASTLKAGSTHPEIIIFEFVINHETAYAHVKNRIKNGAHGPSINTFLSMYHRFSHVPQNKFNVIFIDAERHLDQVYSDFVEKLIDSNIIQREHLLC